MAKELTASQRAMQILAEIELEERLKEGKKLSDQSESQEYISLEGKKEVAAKRSLPVQKPVPGNQSHEPVSININKFTSSDVINGIVFSELLGKPLAHRRNRRF